MIVNPQVPLHRLVLSLSESMDYVSASVANHQLRVACMSVRMARLMGWRGRDLRDVCHAAALHDIGLIRSGNRIRVIACNQLEGLGWHSEMSGRLLAEHELLAGAAGIARHHHVEWDGGRGGEHAGQAVPRASHVLALADAVDRELRRDAPFLAQSRELTRWVKEQAGGRFQGECAEAFCQLAQAPAFWLDLSSRRLGEVLADEMDWPVLTLDESTLEGVARLFARLVDILSPWTGTHSAGVAESAVALAARAGFSPREQVLMRSAGYLHDLGKVAIPTDILDKPGRPSPEEWHHLHAHTYHTFRILERLDLGAVAQWAAFHHERLDGQGYPFGHGGRDLTLGSRVLAVADTFTAVAEDRPYRKGMLRPQAMAVLDRQAAGGALDGDVVALLRKDFDVIDAARREAQMEYSIKQGQLAMLAAA